MGFKAKPDDFGDVSIEDRNEKSGAFFSRVFLLSIPVKSKVNPENGLSSTSFFSTTTFVDSSTGVIIGALEKVSPPKDIEVSVPDFGVPKLGNTEVAEEVEVGAGVTGLF